MRLKQAVTFLTLFLGFLCIPASGQEVVATWNGGTGNWSAPTNWTPTGVPINNGPLSLFYSATIGGSNSNVTMDVSGEIDNFNLGVTSSLLNVSNLSLISGLSTNSGTIDNNGSLGSCFLCVAGPPNPTAPNLTNYGAIINESGANIFLTGTTLSNVGTLNNYGKLETFGGSFGFTHLTNSGALNNYGAIILGSTSGTQLTNTTGAYFTNYGTIFNNSNGSYSNAGTFLNAAGAAFTMNAGAFVNTGTFINSSGATLTNLEGGSIVNSGTFINSGAMTIRYSIGNYTQTAGSTVVDGTLTASSGAIVDIQGGTLGGKGTINGNVLMAGKMMPSDAPGTFTIFGNYEQKDTGIFEELMSPYAQAFLDVSGNVVLDPGASLDITLLGGFNPLGDTISIMDFSTLSGQFANGSSFWDDGFLWDITYRQHEVDVTAVQAPEPSSLLLLGIGSLAIGAIAKRKKSGTITSRGKLT